MFGWATIATDLVLRDNATVTINSRNSNNAYVCRINLLASHSNLLLMAVVGDSNVSMKKEVFELNEAFQESLKH